VTAAASADGVRPRRLLAISHSREVGGAEVYLGNLLQHLAGEARDRWQPQLVCRRDHAMDVWAAEIEGWGCPVFRLDVTSPRDALRMAGLIREADLVHLNLAHPAGKYQFAAAFLTRSLGRPLVVTHQLALVVTRPWRMAMRWLSGAARRHIAPSNRTRTFLIDELGYSSDRVVLIYHGVDATSFRPAKPSARAATRESIGRLLVGRPWGEDVQLVCTVARLSPQKGLLDLVEATQLIAKEVLALRLVVVGEGELRKQLDDQVRARGLERHFFLAGAMPRAQIAEWLAASDLFILPSRYEGGPAIALQEAMACGCAVVATDVGGVEELVSDETLGRIVPARDAAALARTAVDLLRNPSARAAMGARGREKVIADFTVDACVHKTLGIYENALGGDA
jgi:glycosyltransferase involved in cell wall biosynthesis